MIRGIFLENLCVLYVFIAKVLKSCMFLLLKFLKVYLCFFLCMYEFKGKRIGS